MLNLSSGAEEATYRLRRRHAVRAAIGERETLVALTSEVGLDPSECAAVLNGDRYAEEVRADERDARELGIPGAQDADTMLGVLQRAWSKAHPLEMVPAADDGIADDTAREGDSCAV